MAAKTAFLLASNLLRVSEDWVVGASRIPDAGKILLHNVYGWFDRPSAASMSWPRPDAQRSSVGRNMRAMSVLPSFESADAWLGCHINLLREELTNIRYG